MSLVKLLEQSPNIVLNYAIKQIVSIAGNGELSDNSECSKELRIFLKNIPIEKLSEHQASCLTDPFDKSGFVLQDIVNEFGRRLDYEVEDGLYRGRPNAIGNDGLWVGPDGHAIIIEIKTSDAYRINLDTIATYRQKLLDGKRISLKSSVLIVVGRNDTGDLEAQIRGSRHAWHTRIISAEALLKLVELKLKSDDDRTTEKIRNLLIPFEYTRLDNIIDVVFSATRDVESTNEEAGDILPEISTVVLTEGKKQDHTPQKILEAVRTTAIAALEKREGVTLIVHKRIQYWTVDKSLRAVCPVSKQYDGGYYWYGLHPHQKAFLEDGTRGFLVLACIGSNFAYAIPRDVIIEVLPFLNTTNLEDRTYWHIHLQTDETGEQQLLLSKKGERISLKEFAVQLL